MFIIMALVGIGAAGINSLQQKISSTIEIGITPTPTPALLFNNQQKPVLSQDTQGQLSSPGEEQYIKDIPAFQPVKQYAQFPRILSEEERKGKKAIIETEKGNIEFEIYPEAVKAVSSFIFLARDGFYNGLTFHRVEPGFVIQGGDPRGNGTGGPGYSFEEEITGRPYVRGTVAMAKAPQPSTTGSQFFIVLSDDNGLQPEYTIIGKVVAGMEVVDQIRVGDAMKKILVTAR